MIIRFAEIKSPDASSWFFLFLRAEKLSAADLRGFFREFWVFEEVIEDVFARNFPSRFRPCFNFDFFVSELEIEN